MAVVVLLALAGSPALAEGETSLPSWEGVYKYRFANAFVGGEKYESENILEIVSIEDAKAYVRARLEFANGHFCSFFGIGRLEADEFIYRARAGSAMGDNCVWSLERTHEEITIHDAGGHCARASCGARGMYQDIAFPAASRRPIRYMPRLKASEQFRRALAESSSD
jgi:hypothetical protein